MNTRVLHITKSCNARCAYCYESDKKSEYCFNELKQFIDFLHEKDLSADQTYFSFEFLGGEPMLSFDILKQCVEYIESLMLYKNNTLQFIITTNGTILTDEQINFLKNHPIKVCISVDGNEWANQFRILNDGTNTHKSVISNINKLLDNNIMLGIHITTHKYNIVYLYDDVIDFYQNKGVKDISIGCIENTADFDYEYYQEYINQMNLLSKFILNNNIRDLYIDIFNLNGYDSKTEIDKVYFMISKKIIGEIYGDNLSIYKSDNTEFITIKNNSTPINTLIKNIAKQIHTVNNSITKNPL